MWANSSLCLWFWRGSARRRFGRVRITGLRSVRPDPSSSGRPPSELSPCGLEKKKKNAHYPLSPLQQLRPHLVYSNRGPDVDFSLASHGATACVLSSPHLSSSATTPFLTAQTGLETHIIGIEVPTIPNAPFTAKEFATWDEILPGGGTVATKYYTVIARDSKGLVRRESRHRVPANSNADSILVTLSLLDPANHTRINCVAVTKLCQVVDMPHPVPVPRMVAMPPRPLPGNRFLSRENLGLRDFLGLTTTGFRDTLTTPPEANGNSGVLIESNEIWLSSDLGMFLYNKRSGPKFGEITLTIGDLVRSEPDPSLLSVPTGYKIVDARASAAIH